MRFRRYEISLSGIAVIIVGGIVMALAIPIGFVFQRVWFHERRTAVSGETRTKVATVVELENGSSFLVGLRKEKDQLED